MWPSFTDVCVPDSAKPNAACDTATTGSSKATGTDGACLPDCKDPAGGDKTISVPGFHDVDGTCTADGAAWMATKMAALVSTVALVMYM